MTDFVVLDAPAFRPFGRDGQMQYTNLTLGQGKHRWGITAYRKTETGDLVFARPNSQTRGNPKPNGIEEAARKFLEAQND
jgi:hypothetical protein